MLEGPQISADVTPVAGRPSRQRSRVSNGSKLMAGVDGRSAEARRYRDLCQSFADDCGGASALSESQRSLIRSAAALSVQSEKLQGAVIRGEPVSDEQLTRVANSLSRTLARLKRPAPRIPSLAEYISRPRPADAP
jgi:phage-related minor tail protein